MLLFLHGYGECGTDIDLVKVHGPPKRCHQLKELQKCIIISPQCPKNSWWRVAPLKTLLDEVKAQRNDINPERVYVTGLSMGGYGTWSLLSQYPDYFKAALPICGGGNPLALSEVPSINGDGIKNEFSPGRIAARQARPDLDVPRRRRPHGANLRAARVGRTAEKGRCDCFEIYHSREGGSCRSLANRLLRSGCLGLAFSTITIPRSLR